MNLKQLAYNTYKANEAYFVENNVKPNNLVEMYKIYYSSLVGEVFNPDKTKYYIYLNKLGVFKNSLSNWVSFLKTWRTRLRISNLQKEENPEQLIKLYRDKVYRTVRTNIEIQFEYIENVKNYIEYDRLTYEEAVEFHDIFEWVLQLGEYILKLNTTNKKIAIKRLEYFENLEA